MHAYTPQHPHAATHTKRRPHLVRLVQLGKCGLRAAAQLVVQVLVWVEHLREALVRALDVLCARVARHVEHGIEAGLLFAARRAVVGAAVRHAGSVWCLECCCCCGSACLDRGATALLGRWHAQRGLRGSSGGRQSIARRRGDSRWRRTKTDGGAPNNNTLLGLMLHVGQEHDGRNAERCV
jgi:hypothetical protein